MLVCSEWVRGGERERERGRGRGSSSFGPECGVEGALQKDHPVSCVCVCVCVYVCVCVCVCVLQDSPFILQPSTWPTQAEWSVLKTTQRPPYTFPISTSSSQYHRPVYWLIVFEAFLFYSGLIYDTQNVWPYIWHSECLILSIIRHASKPALEQVAVVSMKSKVDNVTIWNTDLWNMTPCSLVHRLVRNAFSCLQEFIASDSKIVWS